MARLHAAAPPPVEPGAQPANLNAADPGTVNRPVLQNRARRPRRPPAALTPMVGREATLSGLVDALDGGRRLITVVGPGGVGKTRLLLELGAHYRDRRPIEYGELGGVTATGVGELAETVALSLGLEVSARGAARSLVEALADDAWLLLVDEAEAVADALGPLATRVLEGNPDVQIVVSSRRPLDVPGELVWPVEPLDCSTPDGGDPRAAPAVRLLLQRLADRAVTVDDTASTTAMLHEMTARVDGLPLALELVAAQASGRSLLDLVELVRAPLDVPAENPRRPRLRSLRRTFASSLEQLDPLPRIVFRRLGVFAGSFDQSTVRAVLTLDGEDGTDHAAVVPALVRDALVQVDRRDPGRLHFRLLSVLRELALEAATPGELDQLRARHRRHFADRWRRDRGRDELFQDVRDHREDYLQALTNALTNDDGDAATDLALTLAEYWQLAGARLAGTKWLGLVLVSRSLSPAGRARLQVQRAVLLQNHDKNQVLADTTDALSVLDPAVDAESVVLAFAVRAVEQWIGGEPEAAVTDADRGVEIASRGGPQCLAQALATQALLHAVTGDRRTGLAAARRTRKLLPSMPWASQRLAVALNLSLALVNLGEFADAVRVLDVAALDLPQAVGRESPAPPRFWINLGWAALGMGDLDRSWDNFVQSLHWGGPISLDRQSAEVLLGIGCVLSARADPAPGPVLAGSRELLRRLAVPMSEEWIAEVDRAARAAGGSDAGDQFSPPDEILWSSLPDEILASSLPDEILFRQLGEHVEAVLRRP